MPCLVVKLGSSIVADGRGEVRRDVLSAICDQLAELHHAGRELVIVTSGAIARGMGVMEIPLRPRTIDELQAASAVGQGKLYQVYDQLLRDRGVPTAQVLLTFFDISARTHYLNARQTLRKLLEWRVVPVINENDTTTTDEISFGNNDFLAAQVAILLGAEQLLLLTDADGVFTADPRTSEEAQLVSEVHEFAELEGLDIGHASSPLGSGGMRSKVVAAEMATAAGIPTVIGSGLDPETIRTAAAGSHVGTTFAASSGRYSSFKLWLKYAKPVRGRVVVDAGAARALREGGTSLLPVGIVDVSGEFDAGDAVEIAHDGRDGRQGDLQLLSRRAAQRARSEIDRRPRPVSAGQRGGRAPRLLRARLGLPSLTLGAVSHIHCDRWPTGPWREEAEAVARGWGGAASSARAWPGRAPWSHRPPPRLAPSARHGRPEVRSDRRRCTRPIHICPRSRRTPPACRTRWPSSRSAPSRSRRPSRG